MLNVDLNLMILRFCAALICFFCWGTIGDATPLLSREFTLAKESEVALEIEANSPGASWARKDAEASALRIEVDGQYNQDLLLAAGASPFIYRVTLGRLVPGKHQVTVSLNKARSAVGAQQATVRSLRPIPLAKDSHHSADDLLALAYSPVLYQRANTIDRFSDLPLLMYYEIFHPTAGEVQIRYTTIFTNEDGGTPTAALMARWGRAADIEWVYEFRVRDGKVVEETYQAVNHQTKAFQGERMNGKHPLLAVASDNNNFSDETKSVVRFALLPISADLRDATRESVMDTHPWTYRLVAEELLREGKIKPEPLDGNTISDPRDYVYVDLSATQKGSAISVDAHSNRETIPALSDLGEAKLRIDRSGHFRTAIRMTSAESAAAVSSLTIHCYSDAGHDCEEVELKSVSVLNSDYTPRYLTVQRVPPQKIKPNETITISVRGLVGTEPR